MDNPGCARVESHTLITGVWRGNRAVLASMVMGLKGFVKDSEGFIEEICCAIECHVDLFECFFPSLVLVEDFKTLMMFIHDCLLCIQHETIDGCHMCLPSMLIELAQ
jgi:hypothetical protein